MPIPYQYGFQRGNQKLHTSRTQQSHLASSYKKPTSAVHSELLAPQSDGNGRDVSGVVFRLRNISPSLRAKLKSSTFLGAGLSGYVWDLHDGTVLKLTREVDSIRVARTLLQEPIHGLARVCAVLPNIATSVGFYRNGHLNPSTKWMDKRGYSAIVMKKYDAIPPERWQQIQDAWKHLDFSDKPDAFGRGPEGAPASGQMGADIAHEMSIIARRMRKVDSTNPVAQCIMATTMLSKWLRSGLLHRHTGIDVDHADNWGVDEEGRAVIIDPLYTRRVGREEQLRSLETSLLPLEIAP